VTEVRLDAGEIVETAPEGRRDNFDVDPSRNLAYCWRGLGHRGHRNVR
jgi:hypothetical protein